MIYDNIKLSLQGLKTEIMKIYELDDIYSVRLMK